MSAPRIASLLASSTEILYGLGLGDQVVAVSHECDYPPQVRDKPRVTHTNVAVGAASGEIDRQVRDLTATGGALYEIDVEALAGLSPDLIVTQAQCDVCAVRYEDVISAIQQRPELQGARVVALNPQNFVDILDDVRSVGQAAGCAETADRCAQHLQDRIDAVEKRTDGLAPAMRPRVTGIEWIEPVMVAGNWMPDMIGLAGGVNHLTEPGKHSPYVPWETICEEDPQVLILMPCGFDLERTLEECRVLSKLPGWRELSAVREGRVWAVDGNAYFNRSGPRMIDSLEILAHLVHPEFMPRPTTGREVWKRVEM